MAESLHPDGNPESTRNHVLDGALRPVLSMALRFAASATAVRYQRALIYAFSAVCPTMVEL